MRRLATLVCATLLSAPIWAMHCPQDMARIDELLKSNPPASAEVTAEVQRLRAEGEALHKGGDHAESMRVLKQALDLLQGSE